MFSDPSDESILKRPRRTQTQSVVRFDQVAVYIFPRCQGFSSVPSRGGATLGMVRGHSALRRYTVAEHAAEQRQRRQERRQERQRQKRFEALKHKVSVSGCFSRPSESQKSSDVACSHQLIVSGAAGQHHADGLAVDQALNEEAELHVTNSDLEDGGFLRPVSSTQRQVLLQAAGVTVIDVEERRQLRGLRLSREACGCDCQGFCEPESCACSLAGIKCQVTSCSCVQPAGNRSE